MLLPARPVLADVLYLEPETVPDELEATGWGTDVKRGEKTHRCFRGRILEVLPTPRGALRPRIRFEPARVTVTEGAPGIEWLRPRRSFVVDGFGHVDPELDGLFDLQGMFSNRDAILRAMTGDRTIRIGREPFHTYFLRAGGVDVGARLGRMGGMPAGRFEGLLQEGRLRRIDAAVFEGVLREGWLVNWLGRGGPMGPAVRADRLRRVYTSGRVDGTADFAETIHGFHPLALESRIESLGFQLLTTAAQDFRYTSARQPDGPFGLGTTRSVPRFGSMCLDALGALCAQVEEDHPGAEAMGYMARDAVLAALFAARVGQSDASDRTASSFEPPAADDSPRQQASTWLTHARRLATLGKLDDAERALAEARRAAEGIPSARTRELMARRIAGTESVLVRMRDRPPPAARPARPAGLTQHLRTDPGDRAEAALRVITRGVSWQTARFDSAQERTLARRWASMAPDARPAARPRPGSHLIRALLGLAREPRSGTEARAGDRVRTKPAPGATTLLETGLVRAFDHVLARGQDRPIFLAHLGDGLVDAVSGTTVPPAAPDELALDVHAESAIAFALRTFRRAGSVPPEIVDDVVERLFVLALTANSGIAERDRLRHGIRRNALACLAELASFQAHGHSDAATQRSFEATSRSVVERLDGLMRDIVRGHAGTPAPRFFELVGVMAREAEPRRRLEGEAARFADLCLERLQRLAAEDPPRAAGVERLRALVDWQGRRGGP